MGTKNNPGKFDCYAKAEPDEPVFVLLARDKFAAALVWLWAMLREQDGEDPDKVNEARECCATMTSWAAQHGRQSVGLIIRLIVEPGTSQVEFILGLPANKERK